MSGFNFGQPASTGTSSGGLFGTSNSNTGGGLFGNATAPSSTGFSFGNKPATTGGEQKSLFGGTSSTGFSFGAQQTDSKTEPAKSLFGTSQPPATPGASGQSLFGSTTPAGGQPFSFGNPSTTPAGPPPSQSGFGASTGGSNLFGGASTAASVPAAKSAFSLGQPAPPSSSSTTPATTTSSTPSLFGNAGATGGLFGTKPPAPSPLSGGLFGSKPSETSADSTTKIAVPTGEPAKPAFNFGPTTSAAPAASTPSLFGGNSAPTANPGSLFAKPATTETAPKAAFSFGATTTPAITSTVPAASSPATQKPLFGGLGGNTAPAASTSSLFGTPSTSTTTSVPAAAPAPVLASTSSGSLFSGFSVATSAPSTKPSTAASAFSFGTPNTTTASQPSIATPATTTTTTSATTQAPVNLTATATATSAAPTAFNATLGVSTSGPAPPAQSRLRNKTMDEILTRWATDLTRYSKEFKTHAETIAQWDQIIVDNSQKIDKLYVKTRTCEKQTMGVEMQLAAVENQQNELESWLAKYENDVEEMLAKDGVTQSEIGGPDQEREKTYKLAEKLGARLEDMGKDLESMVEEVNTANASLSKHTKSDEPITQIVRILNSHLTQLQVIDQGTAQLQAKVTAAQKAASGTGYLNGTADGDARAAVDDFYRSYMGRR